MADAEKKYVEMSATLEVNISELLSQFMTQQFLEMLKRATQRREMKDDGNK